MTDRSADIEAVARALLAIEDSWNDHDWEQLPYSTQVLFKRQARAAIEALRPLHAAAPVQVGEVVVEQCDRDAAVEIGRGLYGKRTAEMLTTRMVDRFAGHFARHRLAAEAKARLEAYEDAAGVASEFYAQPLVRYSPDETCSRIAAAILQRGEK